MNYRMIFNTIGKVLIILILFLLVPLVCALCYQENVLPFVYTILISLVLGALLFVFVKPKKRVIYAREGLIIVALSWILVSLIGTLPFIFSGDIPNFIDAFFETVSGFTTTGASLFSDVSSFARSTLFWRSLTQWIGGMGVIVFVMALVSKSSDRTMNILRAEMPGPTVDKFVSRAKNIAKILYLIYIVMTAILIVLLLLGGMSVYDSFVHAFSTAGTGGFGIQVDSIASYSPYIQWVIAIFMLLFGVNFNIYFLILVGKFGMALKNRELILYFVIVLSSVVIVTASIASFSADFGEAIRTGFFQVSSTISTTGFTTVNINTWSTIARGVLLCLMFIGGCAGSTAGGLKVSRLSILASNVNNGFKKTVFPNSNYIVKQDAKRVGNDIVQGIVSYFVIYMLLIFIIFLIVSIDSNFGIESNFSATVSCFNNVGLIFGEASYASYSPFSKVILSFAMLFGRLEIYPLLVLFNPFFWKKKF